MNEWRRILRLTEGCPDTAHLSSTVSMRWILWPTATYSGFHIWISASVEVTLVWVVHSQLVNPCRAMVVVMCVDDSYCFTIFNLLPQYILKISPISWLLLDCFTLHPSAQMWAYTPHLHTCTATPLVDVLFLWQSLQGVLIESPVVKDKVSGTGFVMGVVETLLSFWLHWLH